MFTIGHQVVFRLARWSARLRTGFPVPRATQGLPRRPSAFAHGPLTLSGAVFQPLALTSGLPYWGPTTPRNKFRGLASSLFARHYWGNRSLFLFLRILRCFTSPRLAFRNYEFAPEYPGIHRDGLPHSETHGSMRACRSPWLIATYCVLHRRLVPRHSPAALSSLTKPISRSPGRKSWFALPDILFPALVAVTHN